MHPQWLATHSRQWRRVARQSPFPYISATTAEAQNQSKNGRPAYRPSESSQKVSQLMDNNQDSQQQNNQRGGRDFLLATARKWKLAPSKLSSSSIRLIYLSAISRMGSPLSIHSSTSRMSPIGPSTPISFSHSSPAASISALNSCGS